MMAGCNPTKVIEEAANGKFAYEIGACGDDDKLIWFKDNSVEILNHELKNIKGPKRVSGVKAKYFAKKTRHGWYELRYNVANVSVLDKRATSGQIILKLVYKSDQDLRLMSGAIPFKKNQESLAPVLVCLRTYINVHNRMIGARRAMVVLLSPGGPCGLGKIGHEISLDAV